MAKKKHLSELMRKRDNKVVNENPFEIKINKRRHEVLGQKVMKWEKGKPGVSKSKWMKERMESLLTEYQNRNKDNRIKDKPKVTTNVPGKAGDAVQKFKVARKNMARLYNLEDDGEEDEESIQVTHKGRLLTEIEKFDDLDKDSDDEEEEKVFREKFSEVQFGGPTNARAGKKGMEQIILDSIVDREAKRKEKRQREILKESIMKEFEEIRPAFNAGLKTFGEEKPKEENDGDLFMKLAMLKNAPRCTPADQVVSEEKNKINKNKMEQERLQRMNPHNRTMKHRSADDLDDDDESVFSESSFNAHDEDEDDQGMSDGDAAMQKDGDNDDDDNDDDDDEDDDEEEEEEDENVQNEDEDGDGEEGEEVDENEEMEVDDDECLITFTKMLKEVDFTTPDKFRQMIDDIYKLSRKNPKRCAKELADAVFEHHLDFQVQIDDSKDKIADLPGDFKLIFLVHFVGNVYSTSDYHHPVVTPTVLLMSQLLTHGAIKTTNDIAYGLLLCSYFLLYVQESKRFVPEVINFLTSVIFLHSSERRKFYIKNVRNADLLVVTKEARHITPIRSITASSIFSTEGQEFLKSDEFKVSSLLTTMNLAKKCLEIYSRLPSAVVIFKPMLESLNGIETSLYPPCIDEICQELLEIIESLRHPSSRLIRSENKPIPLRQYAPKLKEVSKRRKVGEGIKKEELNKYRKLERGIKREIRKEQNLKNKIKFDEMVHEKNMRSEKTKKILNELANQEGEFNSMKKKRKLDSGKKGKMEKF